MTRPIRFGVTLPQIKRTWEQARDAAIQFDRLGFDSVWVCDHLYGVPLPNLVFLPTCRQALQPKGADRLQHPVARSSAGVRDIAQQTLGHQGANPLQRPRTEQGRDRRRPPPWHVP